MRAGIGAEECEPNVKQKNRQTKKKNRLIDTFMPETVYRDRFNSAPYLSFIMPAASMT